MPYHTHLSFKLTRTHKTLERLLLKCFNNPFELLQRYQWKHPVDNGGERFSASAGSEEPLMERGTCPETLKDIRGLGGNFKLMRGRKGSGVGLRFALLWVSTRVCGVVLILSASRGIHL